MIDTITLKNGSKTGVGCWLDGWHGWTNAYRVVDLAMSHGMELDAEDAAIVEWYRESGESDADASDETLNKLEAMNGQGGISDKATDYLMEQLPEGWTLRWDDGLTCLPVWTDCEADGGGCETTEGFYPDGTPFIKPCINHKPEHVIRVTFTQGTSGGEGPTVYTVALWDEDGETLSGSTQVRYPGAAPHPMGGEHWFADVIETTEIREAALKLLKAARCEGHYDDDAALTSGVGIGEGIRCDGSCAR